MSNFTISVTSSATNPQGNAYGQQPDQNTPSFLDLHVTNSSDPLLPNGVYDAYCLNPLVDILVAPTQYQAVEYPGAPEASFDPIGFASLSQTQVDELNWLLAQDFTLNPQFNFGEVQIAIWKIIGFTDAQINGAGLGLFLNDNNRNVVDANDTALLVTAAQTAIANGNGVLPTDTHFTEVIDPDGNVQPLIIQLKRASLGDRLWVDTNHDGQQNDGATGIVGATVTLIGGGADGLISTTGDNTSTSMLTGTDGFYQFTGLTPGVEYQVQFAAPAGYLFTSQDVGNDASDSDADTTTGKTQIVKLASGEYNPTLDAGVYQTAGLGDYVWEDKNANGIQDDGATGIDGATVTLKADLDNNGSFETTVGTATTGDDPHTAGTQTGYYEFTGLTPGVKYQVQFATPAGFNAVSPRQVAAGTAANNSDGLVSDAIVLSSGEFNPTIDSGFYKTASLGDRLWVDTNHDGQQNDGATGIVGATVTLIGGGADGLISTTGDNTSTSMLTGTDGFYQFTGLTPGVEYQVQFAAPAGYLFTSQDVGNDASDSDADTTTGKTQIVKLASGEYNPTLDAGVYQTAGLGDYVWEDKNANGIQDDGATGIDGATVTLKADLDNNGSFETTVGTATTGDDPHTAGTQTGYYEFTGLTPGVKYQVQFATPAGFNAVSPRQVAAGTAANNSDGLVSDAIVLSSGEFNPTIDSGFYKTASLGDRLWVNTNHDGQQNDGATGIVGATVTLIGGGADGLISTTGDNTSTSMLTGTDGFYQFTGLTPGVEYQVQFAAPAGYLFTSQDVGNDASDSDADTTTGKTQIVKLASGEYNPTLDAGVYGLTPGIDIEKTTNGPSNANLTAPDYDNEDSANGAGVPILTPGDTVTWTYKVTNTGNTTFAKGDVAIVDDSGTPLNTGDDLSVANGKITYLSGDVGNDNLLSPGEVWLYQATGIVQNLTTLSAASTFDFNGSSATDGADGNIRTFTAGSISVHASAFSRDKASGDWAQAWLGSYGGGLGVTDSGEGSGGNNTHTVDNTGGRDNYVLFEFDKNVVVDSAFLGYVVNDSDMQVWIGTRTNAFNNHDTLLSDSDLSALGFTELNSTTLTTTRLADLNAGNVSGNVLVIAADTTDTSPEDMFKIQKLTVEQPQSGVYENKATVTAPGAPGDFDLSHYKNPVVVATPKIDIEKTTTGPSNANPTAPDYDNEDAANGVGVPILTPGSAVTWTYKVTNTGNTTFAKADVAIVDDSGTPLNGADDLSVANGKITYLSGDVGNDNLLSPGEVWLYKATGIVQNLTTLSAASTFDFNGSSATDGADGNIRTFTAGSISVHASAFSRDKASGDWAQAWLGSYGGGLGVTDSGEGSGGNNTHTVDNTGGRDNYVLFEFDKNVVVDSAFLGYVVNDSDMQVWIGTRTNAFNNHDTLLSDSDLSALGFTELNSTTLTTTRLADLNAGNVSGNVLVIAADTTDTSPEDMFKIQKLTVEQPQSGVYENKATVTAPGAPGDSDLSHYKNPAPVVPAQIGDFVWEDKNANGIQDAGEAGIANVTVKLLNSVGTVLATTATNANGQYLFSNLNPGDYKVQVVAPNGYSITGKDLGGNDAKDSDIDATGTTVVTTLSAGENDLSWDAGLYRKASVGDKVWEDWNHNNVQDVGEGGIGNITVKLMDGSGTSVLATTKTDVNGNYLFSNLDPGNYVLQFDKTNVTFNNSHWGGSYNMSNWKWAVKDAGNNDAIDSDVAGDAIATTNVSKTDAFTLVSGQNDMTRDAGITPIVIDLDGNGIQTISRANSAGTFDLFGNGSAVASGWISGGDGFLAVDKNGNGKIDDISELFGGTAKGAGFAQLASYDSNGDGVVNAADSAFSEMSIWRDTNGNHQTDAGELMTLAQAGVSELRVGYAELAFLDQQGNVHLERSNATMSDGKSVDMTDVYFNVSVDDAAAAGVELPGIAELLKGAPALSASDAGLVDLSVWRDAKAVPPTDSGSTGAITNAGVVGLSVDSLGDLFAAVGGYLQPEGIVRSASHGHDGMDLNDGCFNTAANDASIAGHLPVTDPGWLFA